MTAAESRRKKMSLIRKIIPYHQLNQRYGGENLRTKETELAVKYFRQSIADLTWTLKSFKADYGG